MSKPLNRAEQNKIIRDSYMQTQKEAKEIRDRAGINSNPILQKSKQYVYIKIKYNILYSNQNMKIDLVLKHKIIT